ncbi:MAG: M1 family metallopeptidase [Phycisphaerales bacterium]|nr:M1 family metallopeptidase [Phycisphaerales bacterium]
MNDRIRAALPLVAALWCVSGSGCARDKAATTAGQEPPPVVAPEPAKAPEPARPAEAQQAVVVVAPEAPTTPAATPDQPRAPRRRDRGSRDETTIFSPLELPPGDSIRLASGAPGPDYWQQQVDYVIRASLDADTNTVAGEAIVTYHNNSPHALDYIWLHLEQNIFREDSVGAAISRNTAIGMREAAGEGCRIDRLRAGGYDLEYHVYDTMARIDLASPIAPGGSTFSFEIAWSFTIPERAFRRFGIERVEQGTIYEIAQWFPAVAVYDDVDGWNTLGYLGTGEFYTNFGAYDVRLTVPRRHIVVATGVLQNPADVFTPTQLDRWQAAKSSDETVMILAPEEVGDPASRPAGEGPLTWHFKAEDVRTFAWAGSDAFIYDACNLEGTLIQSAYPKEATPVWHKSTQMLRTAIAGYNRRWFKYPYPAATNVNGPEGGMEYPMIIFCGGRRSEQGLYGVTTHEIGHNWFPMVVNTDERRYAWMDEGFNSFINYYSGPDWFGGEPRGRGDASNFARGMRQGGSVPMMTYADRLPASQLGSTQYAKPAVGLVLLREQILGEERFDRAFREYIRRWAFKSPQPADFFRTMEDVAGADLAWFWRGWFYEVSVLDQGLAAVEQQQRDDEGFNVEVTIENLEELVMPVAVELTFEDGSTQRRTLPVEIWFNTNRYNWRWQSPQRLRRIVIDPDEAFPDVERGNNVWEQAPQ